MKQLISINNLHDFNGYYILFELEDVLKIGYNNSILDFDSLDWFVNEVKNLENKVAFYFKNTQKNYIMTEENEEDYIK